MLAVLYSLDRSDRKAGCPARVLRCRETLTEFPRDTSAVVKHADISQLPDWFGLGSMMGEADLQPIDALNFVTFALGLSCYVTTAVTTRAKSRAANG